MFVADQTTGFSRFSFAVKETGLHTILVQKQDAENNEVASATVYKSLSYSKEYDVFADTEAAEALAKSLSEDTDGTVIIDPLQVFDNSVEYLHTIIDPRTPFLIIIISFFLIDIAARKFKWKWPHELIRDNKNKAAVLSK